MLFFIFHFLETIFSMGSCISVLGYQEAPESTPSEEFDETNVLELFLTSCTST